MKATSVWWLNPFSSAPEQCSGATERYSPPAPEHCSGGKTRFFNLVLRGKSMHTQWEKGSYCILLPSRPRYVVFTVQFKENYQFLFNFVVLNEQTSTIHHQARLKEVFADKVSNYHPEEEDIRANLSENVSKTGENVGIDTSDKTDAFLESNPQTSVHLSISAEREWLLQMYWYSNMTSLIHI